MLLRAGRVDGGLQLLRALPQPAGRLPLPLVRPASVPCQRLMWEPWGLLDRWTSRVILMGAAVLF